MGVRRGAVALLVQEPYVGATGELTVPGGARVVQARGTEPNWAAVVVLDNSATITVDPALQTDCLAVAILDTDKGPLALMSAYIPPRADIAPHLTRLAAVIRALPTTRLVLAGDFNAWHTLWGSARTNDRGEALADLLAELDLEVLNEGSEPTFQAWRAGREHSSRVDVTFCDGQLLSRVLKWSIHAGATTSAHAAIEIVLAEQPQRKPVQLSGTRAYNTKKADWLRFREALEAELSGRDCLSRAALEGYGTKESVEGAAQEYVAAVTAACDASIPKLKPPRLRADPPWWTPDLEKKRREVLTKKRRIRCAAPRRRQYVVDIYLAAKEEYRAASASASTASWVEFCSAAERESMWDGIYRVLRTTERPRPDELLRGPAGTSLTARDSAQLLADVLFPDDDPSTDTPEQASIRSRSALPSLGPPDPPFGWSELRSAASSFAPRKAPGSDHLTPDVCTRAVLSDDGRFLALANACLRVSSFPEPWKEASIKVIPKPNKSDRQDPRSYRPIGLLSVLGKTLEKMLVGRLRHHLLPTMNPRQYGFVPQRGTDDALYDLVEHVRGRRQLQKICFVISLDIQGAFDNAWWPAAKIQLRKRGCPANLCALLDDYLENRKITINYAGEEWVKQSTRGCVQGSIAGPTLWNVIFDPLIVELEGRGLHVQAFADDLTLVLSGETMAELEARATEVLAYVYDWGTHNKLQFAPHKTNLMVVTRRQNVGEPVVRMGGTLVAPVKAVKVLGVVIDAGLSFGPHVEAASKKATAIFRQVSRAARVTWGLNSDILRTIYTAVVEPVMLYGACVWGDAAKRVGVRKRLRSVQRGFVLRVARAYRTVSFTASLAITGLLPLDLRALEVLALYEVKRGRPLPEALDRPLEARVSFLQARHPALWRELPIGMVEGEEELEAKVGAEGLCIYTDGSKIDGKVGAAVTVWRDGVEVLYRTLKLESFCTVYQAELLAILEATGLAEGRTDKIVTILSDSRSSLEAIVNNKSVNPLAFGAASNIARLQSVGVDVRLVWVRAHVGLPGNERADELAKRAAHKKVRANYDRFPVSYARRMIREGTRAKWAVEYAQNVTGKNIGLFLPDLPLAYQYARKHAPTALMSQALTGHGGVAEYLHRFTLKADPWCVCEPDVIESVPHILTACPRFAIKRRELEMQLDTSITIANLPLLLTGRSTASAFAEYCERLMRLACRGNGSTANWAR